MHRLFGKKKEVAPPPSLEDTSKGIDTRVEALDKKINGLNKELKVYQGQISKAKGAAKQNLQKRAMDILKRKRMYEQQREQLTGQQFNLDQVTNRVIFVLIFLTVPMYRLFLLLKQLRTLTPRSLRCKPLPNNFNKNTKRLTLTKLKI